MRELLNNAISATKQRWGDKLKTIKVKAEVVQGVLELEVIDQGVGIPPEVQAEFSIPSTHRVPMVSGVDAASVL